MSPDDGKPIEKEKIMVKVRLVHYDFSGARIGKSLTFFYSSYYDARNDLLAHGFERTLFSEYTRNPEYRKALYENERVIGYSIARFIY